jgi:large subunit ribosomal protein L24
VQTTLLSLAVAAILALLAALIAPLVIDWGGYRSVLEKEASHFIGVDVHVSGAIDARLLPSPRLQLHDVEIGSGDDKLRARGLEFEFALGPLMRGEWRATQVRLVAPEMRLGLDAGGRVSGPRMAIGLDPDAISIERLSIEDGKAVLSDAASGKTIVLDKLWFNGELRSLLGPVRGEGAVTVGGELYPYRLSSSRINDDGTFRVRLNIDPVNIPLNIEADGALSLAAGKPRFDGNFSFTQPAALVSAKTDAAVRQPWRLSGKVKATPASALMEQVDFQYGSEADAVKLAGTAELRFGAHPGFNGVLSARQIDLDKLLGNTEANRPPAATLRQLISAAGSAFRPPLPIQIGLGLDQVTLGGAIIQNVRGDVSTDADGWVLDRFEFRAPGQTQVRVSGQLSFDSRGATFTGPAEVDAGNPRLLTAWLEGRADDTKGLARALKLRGDVTLGAEKIAIERLNATFDRGAVAGRFVYTYGAAGQAAAGAELDAALSAPELDLDAAAGFARALMSGSSLPPPSKVSLAVDIGRGTVAGFDAGKATTRLRYDSHGLHIERLAVENFGGANIAASGQVAMLPSPRGALTLDFQASDLSGVNAALERYLPKAAETLRRAGPAITPAKLRVRLNVDGDAPANHAALAMEGQAGALRVNLAADTTGDLTTFNLGDLHLQGQISATDGRALGKLLGLDRVVAIGKEPGLLRATLAGNPSGAMRLVTTLTAGGLDVSSNGTVNLPAGGSPSGSVYVNVGRADLEPLRRAFGRAGALPAAMTGLVNFNGDEATIDQISAIAGGSRLRGKLTLGLGAPYRIGGELEGSTIDAGALIAAAAGLPAGGALWNWSADPISGGGFGVLEGTVALRAMRADIAGTLVAREFRGKVTFGKGSIALNDISAAMGGGRLSGQIELKETAEGLNAQSHLSLSGADIAALLPDAARPPVTGKISMEWEINGAGRSPVALVGSLHGGGKFTLSGARFARLNPRAFAAVTQAVDNGMAVESGKISDLAGKALDSGELAVTTAQGELSVSAGQVRLSNASVQGKGADASLGGSLDLTNGALDLRLVLAGDTGSDATRPDIFVALRGPMASPSRTIDVSALTGWLTMRAIERQAKRLEAIEKQPPAAATPPATPPPAATPPAAAAPPSPPPAAQTAAPLPAPIIVEPAPRPAAKPAPKPPSPPPAAEVRKRPPEQANEAPLPLSAPR